MEISRSRSDRRESSVATLVNNPIAVATMYGAQQNRQLEDMQRRASSQTVVAGEQQQQHQTIPMMHHSQSAFAALPQQQMQNRSGSLLDFDLDMEMARPLEQLWGATPFDASLFMMPPVSSSQQQPPPKQQPLPQQHQQQQQTQMWPTSAGFPMPNALLSEPGLDAITSTIFDTRFIDARASALAQGTPSEPAVQPGGNNNNDQGLGQASSSMLRSPVPLHWSEEQNSSSGLGQHWNHGFAEMGTGSSMHQPPHLSLDMPARTAGGSARSGSEATAPPPSSSSLPSSSVSQKQLQKQAE
ncbi:hypothetical protein FBU59_003043, partial [Linderina macrospora]